MSTKKKKASEKISRKELEEKCLEYLNGWKRAQADYHNLERETAKQRQEWIKTANADLLYELLPIYDNLNLALKHIPQEQINSQWLEGIKHIRNQFKKFLSDFGVEEIKTVGMEFNPELHEAVKHGEKTDRQADSTGNIIKQEIRAGYKLNGKVLYPAKVVI